MSRTAGKWLRHAAAGILFLCGAGSAQAGSGVIVAFGDSITAGYPYLKVGNGCTSCGGYERYLQQFLDWEGQGRVVYNYGVAGELLSTQGISRIDTVMAGTGADYVLLMEGTNDLLHYVDPATVAYNLYLAAEKVRQRGGVPIVATLTPDTRYGKDWKHISSTNSYIKSYVSGAAGMCLSDQYSAVAPYWRSRRYTYDKLHPTYWGYWLMAWQWYVDLAACGSSR